MRTAAGIRAGLAAVGLSLVACIAAPSAFGAALLEPDLTPEPASDLSLVYSGPIRTELRLATTIRNVGRGPLELYPVPGGDCDNDGDVTNDRLANQRVFEDGNGNGVFDPALDTDSTSYLAGCMMFHPAHNHWHFDDFSNFELLAPSGQVVASTDKVSFCLDDTSSFDLTLPGAPATGQYLFTSCQAASTEGISVGWRDTYFANLPGQSLDIEGVRDGDYCLAVSADPDNLLRESSDSNNIALRGISLDGDTIADSPQACTPGQPGASQPTSSKKKRRCRANKNRRGKRHKRCKKKRRKNVARESGSAFPAASAAEAG